MNGPAATVGLVGLALAALPARPRPPSPFRRLRDLTPRPGLRQPHAVHLPGGRAVLAVLVGSAVAALAGIPAGPVAGAAAAWVAWRGSGRLDRVDERRSRQVREAEIPPVLDLLAACLRAGLPVGPALSTVASALPGEVGSQLGRVAALYELGAGTAAWNDVRSDPVLAPVARSALRSGESGSALASDLACLADEHRDRAALAATARTRRVALVALAPLGLCFLPAFVCLGVVPVVLSVAHQVLGGLT